MAEISRESLGITDGKPKPATAKPTEEKLKPVVSGGVERRQPKPNVVHKFFGGDPRDVGRYIVMDIMLPAAKGLLLDIICKGSERLILGDTMTDRDVGDIPELRRYVRTMPASRRVMSVRSRRRHGRSRSSISSSSRTSSRPRWYWPACTIASITPVWSACPISTISAMRHRTTSTVDGAGTSFPMPESFRSDRANSCLICLVR